MKERMMLIGKRFGRLLVIEKDIDSIAKSGYIMPLWKCKCDCGNIKTIRQQKLKSGNTKSCGCIRKEKAKIHGANLNLVKNIKKYIYDRIIINKQTNCWEWTGTYFSSGYARSGILRHPKIASRLSYEEFTGEIPKGLLVCHTCDNPKCVNPDHLFLGTHKDNSKDMVNKGRSNSGELCHNSKLKEKQVKIIIRSRLKFEYLSNLFKVSICTIRDIKNKRTWRNINK